MAHDLRKISNKSYNCYGNGRDWFFLGDSEYREGRRTPQPNSIAPRPVPPPAQKKGAPAEVRHQSACHGSRKKMIERWHKLHAERPATFGTQQENAVRAEATEPMTSPEARTARLRRGHSVSAASTAPANYFTTYNEMGRDPRAPERRYVLDLAEQLRGAGVPRSSSEPVLKEMEGDHTRGIRGSLPHFHSTYMDLGKVPVPGQARTHEVLLAQTNREAGIPPREIPPKEIEGDHTQGIKGSKPHYAGTYWDLGQDVKVPQWMGGRKHEVANCENLRDSGVPPREVPPKEIEGDHSRGIRGETPHFFTTSMEHGRFQKVNHQRYDFAPVAHKQYRLTRWRGMET